MAAVAVGVKEEEAVEIVVLRDMAVKRSVVRMFLG